ncbi:hypothetical protein GI374_13340 [Paracoccus sp. S-4012]|uniref:hypothetical protein n=1 Tax=Paracoccus sp. S-4012 TaxID=2665648 RepID=UPI0012B08F77|nr:hypothetical protein [Paracoccus sp. S-4012]MRX51408.1 hypothetical protein [Paracoccus sp. S-4012]
MRLTPLALLPALALLGACETQTAATTPPPAGPPVTEADGPTVVPAAVTDPAAAAAARADAPAAPAAGSLGTTIASLGAAGEGGLWLKTPLVSREMAGRVVNTANGQSANVTLRPLGGQGGSQASLGLMQAVGAGLTDLPELEVFAAG